MSLDKIINVVAWTGIILGSAIVVGNLVMAYAEHKNYQKFKELMIRAIRNKRINMIEDEYRGK